MGSRELYALRLHRSDVAAAIRVLSLLKSFPACRQRMHFCDTVNAPAPVAVHARWVIHSPGIPLNADDLESAYQKPTALKVSE